MHLNNKVEKIITFLCIALSRTLCQKLLQATIKVAYIQDSFKCSINYYNQKYMKMMIMMNNIYDNDDNDKCL